MKKFVSLFLVLMVMAIFLSKLAWADEVQRGIGNINISEDMSTVTINGDGGHFVHDVTHAGQQIKQFNDDIIKHNIDKAVVNCSPLISIGAGVKNGDTSYGGICSVSGSDQVFAVCDDRMVGHFKMSSIDPQSFSKKELIEFVVSNCTGG